MKTHTTSAMRDPRSHRRYKDTRARYLATALGQSCAMCGLPVWDAPTIEHRLPVRTIIATAPTYHAAVEMACDVSMWALAHASCNSRQGARVTNARGNAQTRPSRRWF